MSTTWNDTFESPQSRVRVGDRPRLWWVTAGVFGVVFLLRVTYLVHEGRPPGGNAELERVARCLADKGFLGNAYSADSGPTAHVAPLYASLLAIIYKNFGTSAPAARWAQGLLACLITATMIGSIPALGLRLKLRPRTGILAAIVLGLSPFNLWIETSGSWEQPLSALILLGLLSAFCAAHDAGWTTPRPVVAIAVLMSVSGLLSPAVLAAGLLMLIAEFLLNSPARKPVARGGSLILLSLMICLLPWGLRNQRVLGKFIPLRSNFGLELHLGNHEYATGIARLERREGGRLQHVKPSHPFSNSAEFDAYSRLGEIGYMEEKSRTAMNWIREHPGRFVLLTLQRIRLQWLPTVELWEINTPLRNARPAYFSAINLLAGFGLFVLFRSAHPYRWLIVALVAGYTAPYAITHVLPRYAYALFPLTVLLAVEGGIILIDRLRSWRQSADLPK